MVISRRIMRAHGNVKPLFYEQSKMNSMESVMEQPSSPFCPCCFRSVAPVDQPGDERTDISNGFTEVDMDGANKEHVMNGGPDHEAWSVQDVFRKVFHISVDNKLLLKLYGTKDCLLLEKKRQDKGCRKWMVHPYSYFRWCWDILIVFLLVFTVIILPVSITFFSEEQLQPGWLAMNTLVDILFATDILINFRTGIVLWDKPNQVIIDPKKVAVKYFRGWFAVDFISSLPLDYFLITITRGQINSSLVNASRVLRSVRIVKLITLVKLLRISQMLRLFHRWEELFNLAGGALRVFKLVMLMMLLAHWNGCIQFLVPVLQDVPSTSWVALNNLQNATVGEQYSWSLFKAISHMLCIGFGRWPPQNITDAWLTILSMVLGATFYALFIGSMSTLLLSIDSSGRIYSEKLNQVEEYMRNRKLPQEIRAKVLEYFEHRFRKKFFNEQLILNELSKGLRETIINYNCRELIQAVPFFQNASPLFVTAILTKLRFEVFLKGEYIIRLGTFGHKMYFIQSGTVAVLDKDNRLQTRLGDGSHFGEICLLTDDRRVATIRTETICDLFSLSKQHFETILKEYPDMRSTLKVIALNRLVKLNVNSSTNDIQKDKLSVSISPPSIGSDKKMTLEERAGVSAKRSVFNRVKQQFKRGKKATGLKSSSASVTSSGESACEDESPVKLLDLPLTRARSKAVRVLSNQPDICIPKQPNLPSNSLNQQQSCPAQIDNVNSNCEQEDDQIDTFTSLCDMCDSSLHEESSCSM